MNAPVLKPVLIQVTVFDPQKDDAVIQEYSVNYSERATKDWLMRTTVWAMHNDKVIELSPIKDPANVRFFSPKPIEAQEGLTQ